MSLVIERVVENYSMNVLTLTVTFECSDFIRFKDREIRYIWWTDKNDLLCHSLVCEQRYPKIEHFTKPNG